MCHVDAAARRKAGMPDEWLPYRYEWINEFMLVEGAIPIGTYKYGRRKGRPKFDRSQATKVILSRDDIQDEERR